MTKRNHVYKSSIKSSDLWIFEMVHVVYFVCVCVKLISLYEHNYYDMAKFIKTYGSDFDNYFVPWIYLL